MHPDLDMKNVSKAYAVVKSQDPEPNSIKNTAAAQRLKSLDKRESDARSGRVCRSGSGNDNQGTKAFTASAGSLSGNANPDYIMKRRERI
jgi:hypothetical protein